MKRLLALVPLTALLGGCLSTPAPPPAPYHAVGTEPFWNLLIDEHNVTFLAAGQSALTQPTPASVVSAAGESYRTPRISVDIVHRQCSDGMSDRPYPDSVSLTVDGRGLTGCGGL